jgi:hypothetical protein
MNVASWVTANARQRLGSGSSGGRTDAVWSAGWTARIELATGCSGRIGLTDWLLISISTSWVDPSRLVFAAREQRRANRVESHHRERPLVHRC